MKKLAIGLMTGTSLDGVDVALIEIEGYGLNTRYVEVAFKTFSIEEKLKERIKNMCSIENSNVREICSLNFELAKLYVESIDKLLSIMDLTYEKISFIGSHGQTIWHEPFTSSNFLASTLQIGAGQYIKEKTGITTVFNFRVSDMAQGGQGAPLVPYVDYLLFSSKTEGIILQNIGGIGNLTAIPKNSKPEEILAFDTGPGNMIIDELCKRLKNCDYDKNGNFAFLGDVSERLLEELMNHNFIKRELPKTTGREEFGEDFVTELIKNNNIDANDLIATLTMFTAKSIVYHYEKYVFPVMQVSKIIINGGGSHNKTLMSFLKKLIPENIILLTGEEFGINSDSKEAVAFAILANETLHNQCSNMPKATGAKSPAILGDIALGRNTKITLLEERV